MQKSIILASQSARRKQLLEWAEIRFEVVTSATDEKYPEDLPIIDVPVFIAREKASAVKEKLQNNFHGEYIHQTILAADTIVVLDDTIIGKPIDKEHAVKILTALSGRQHKVITGVVILLEDKEICFADVTEVEFHSLTPEQIEFYVEKYKPYDKAGSYAIQEWIGVVGIKSINGDFYNVMGLPVSKVLQVLNSL